MKGRSEIVGLFLVLALLAALPCRAGYEVNGDGTVSWQGRPYIPLKTTEGFGLLSLEGLDRESRAALSDNEAYQDLKRYGVSEDLVRCKLVDVIDAVKGDHNFSEDKGYGGKSRTLKIGGREYRVTDNRKMISYFTFVFQAGNLDKAHMLVAETPNDRERHTGLRIHSMGNFDFHYGEGGGVYTGREYQCDTAPHYFSFLFFPPAKELRLTVSRLPIEEKITPESGGAVSKIWLLEIEDNLKTLPVNPVEVAKGKERKLGLFYFYPQVAARYLKYLKNTYGISSATLDKSFQFMSAFMRFSGMNAFEFFCLDGGPMCTQIAFTDSTVFPVSGGMVSFVDSLCREMNDNGIYTMPVIPSFTHPKSGLPEGWDKDASFQTSAKGNKIALFGTYNLPDPFRPEVQRLFLQTVKDTAEFFAKYPNVPGIGVYFSGRGGFGCAGADWSDASGWTDASRSCYSKWDVEEFMRETGVSGCPVDSSMKSYEWLKINAWDAWLDWRCKRYYNVMAQAAKAVRDVKPAWKLVLETWLPENPGINLAWGFRSSIEDIMRGHGLDSKYFSRSQDIQTNYSVSVGLDRFMTPTWGRYSPGRTSHHQAYKDFNYNPELTRFYKTGLPGNGLTLNYACWEEHYQQPFPQDSQFAGCPSSLGASTFNPIDRNFYEPIAYSLRHFNPEQIVLQSWERGSFGSEWSLRRLSKAFLAFPFVAPERFSGQVRGADANTVLQWYGDRLCVINDSPDPVEISFEFPEGDNPLYDLTYSRPLSQNKERCAVTLALKPYDIRALARMGGGQRSAKDPKLGVNPPPLSGTANVLPAPDGKMIFSETFADAAKLRDNWTVSENVANRIKCGDGKLTIPVDKGCKEWQIVTSKMKFTPPVTFILNCGWAGDDVDQPSGGMMLWHGSYDQGAFCAGTRNAFLPELFRVGAQIGKNKLFDVDTFVGNGNKIRVDWNADNTITLASLKEGKWVVAASGKGFDAKEANIVLGAVPLGGGGLGMWFGDLRAYKR